MFKETKVLMHSDKISKDVKLLVFSDIHYSGNHDIKKLERLIEKVEMYDMDYICIPGDTIDIPNINCDYMVKFFTKLGSIAPVILSLGNHDIRIKYQEYKIKRALPQMCEKIHVLRHAFFCFILHFKL